MREIVDEAASAPEGTEERKFGDLYASFIDEDRAEQLGAQPISQTLATVEPSAPSRAAGDARAARAHWVSGACTGSSSTTTRATRSATSSSSSRAASRCPTSPTTARRSSPRSATRSLVISSGCSSWPGCRTPTGTPSASSRSRPSSPGTTGTTSRPATARRPTTCSPGPVCSSAGPDLASGWRPSTPPPAPSPRSSCASRASSPGWPRCSPTSTLPAWQDWLRWQVIRSAAAYLSEAFVEANFDFYGRTLTGTPQLRDRWKRGVSLVEGALGEAVGRIYVDRHFPPRAQGADGRAGRQPRRGLPPEHRRRSSG